MGMTEASKKKCFFKKSRPIALLGITVGILVTAFILFVIFSLVGAEYKAKRFLDKLESEVSDFPAYSVNHVVHYQGNTCDVNQVLKKASKESSILEVYAVFENRIYFGYVSPVDQGNPSFGEWAEIWSLASVSMDGTGFQTVYSGVFCNSEQASKLYQSRLNYRLKNAEKNGSVINKKIIFNDFDKVAEYDLVTRSCQEYDFDQYVFEEYDLQYECVSSDELRFFRADEEKTLLVEDVIAQSVPFAQISALDEDDSNIFNRMPFVRDHFEYACVTDDKTYIICDLRDYSNTAFAVVLEYDFDTNQAKYVLYQLAGSNVILFSIIPSYS